MDAVGRVAILTFSTNLNRPYQQRTWEADPVDDMHAVVGSYWLPLLPQSKQVSFRRPHRPASNYLTVRQVQRYPWSGSA